MQTQPTATRALREFLATETAGGALLLAAAIVALVWANSPWQASYDELWHTDIGVTFGRYALDLDLRHWVNDGLMAVFFLVAGLEVKREVLLGELRDRRTAALPVFAAIGGMVVPAVVFLAVNGGHAAGRDGWGIPVATDIAFAIGVLALVAPGIPSGVRLFLLTLAIVDDIGAIVLIAVFYSSSLELGWLAVAVAVVAGVAAMRRYDLRATPVFAALGVALWLALHASGVHATLAGVIMGLMVPATPALDREIVHTKTDQLLDVFTPATARETTKIARQAVSELEWLEHGLHGVSSFLIIPLFALANAGVALSAESLRAATSSPIAWGVVAGLVIGKTVGITAGAALGCRLRLASLPDDLAWPHIVGTAALGGIGFTVSIFISNLAFADDARVNEAKIGILVASVLASVLGAALLRRARPRAAVTT